ncbi:MULTISPECIES: DsbA family protein, partial [Rhizobium]
SSNMSASKSPTLLNHTQTVQGRNVNPSSEPCIEQTLREIGRSVGIDKDVFNRAVADQAILERLNKLTDQATDEFEVEGTPPFFVNGKKITGAPSLEEMRSAIAAALNGH